MRAAVILSVILTSGYGYLQIAPKNRGSSHPIDRRQLVLATERPKQTVALEAIAKFKLVSIKDTYHVGETMVVGAAILNHYNEPVYLPNMFDLQVSIRYENGDPKPLAKFGLAEQVLTPKSYVLLKPGFIQVSTLQFFVGCEEKYFIPIEDPVIDEDNERRVFEKDEYLYLGQGCLRLEGLGSYTISAQLRNDHAVIDPSRSLVKTAVGTITSVPLVIKVIPD